MPGLSWQSLIAFLLVHPIATLSPMPSPPSPPLQPSAPDPSGDGRPELDHARIGEMVKRFWGFDELRPLQAEAIRAGLTQQDSLVVMPTGGGKSLCFQVPPIVAERIDIVVSPLISLMKDQVDGLKACGYPADAIHSNLTPDERRGVFDRIRAGECALLYVSPERLVRPDFQALLVQLDVRGFAIDEAHCISHWGHDFRPEYRQLARLKERFPAASVHAFTATATPRVQADIVAQLGLVSPNVLVGIADRPNLTYRILPRVDLASQVVEVIARHAGEAVIVYCMTRKETETLAQVLVGAGVDAKAYHAGMKPLARRRTQEAFAEERLDVVVATVAFGMGIDRSNVRCVVHAAMPKSIEHYQQETGRAGRDGLEAECVLFYSAADVLRWQGLIERSAAEQSAAEQDGPYGPHGESSGPGPYGGYSGELAGELAGGAGGGMSGGTSGGAPDDSSGAALELLRHMQGLCSTLECRHRALSRYFGQEYDRDREPGGCGACDVCLDEIDAMAGSTEIARKILSCVARLEQRYGVGQVVQVLRGGDTESVRRWGHDRLSVYGLLAEIPEKSLTNLVYQLVDQGLLERSPGDRPVLMLSEASIPVLRGDGEVRLVEPRSRPVAASRAAAESWEGVDRGLFETLRAERRRIAGERSVPPYVVFGDATLRDMARIRPTTLPAMRGVRGVGEKKLADLGLTFVDVVTAFCEEQGIETDVAVIVRPEAMTTGRTRTKAKGVRTNKERDEAMKMFGRGASIIEVVAATGRTSTTVVGYLADFIEDRKLERIDDWVHDAEYERVADAVRVVGDERLRPVYEHLEGHVPFDSIQLVIAHQRMLGTGDPGGADERADERADEARDLDQEATPP